MWGAGQAVIRERAFQAGNSKCKDPEAEPARPAQMEQREGGKSRKRPATGVKRGVEIQVLQPLAFALCAMGVGRGSWKGLSRAVT